MFLIAYTGKTGERKTSLESKKPENMACSALTLQGLQQWLYCHTNRARRCSKHWRAHPQFRTALREPVPGTGQKPLSERRGRGDRALTMVCHLCAVSVNIHHGSFHLPVDRQQHSDSLRKELLILHMLQSSGLELSDVVVIRAVGSN